ncbi:MAG: MBL fold metallo-hydrolase [Candidatus Heimdallarchaeota archaeon]|nr:MBL fold metallo-hydrolase [Candidatus Heimdallarchaeota archaeon]MDH5647327.1 MBL fold metallo-hydrolase [Candidatus Heimdallarchaeota archaeon]
MSKDIIVETDNFTIEFVKPGIWAVIAKVGGVAVSNSGIVDLGDKTILFDTFMSPLAAKELVEKAKDLTNNEKFLIVNSHWHWDHNRGNQVFHPTFEIISTTKTREIMESDGKEYLAKDKAGGLQNSLTNMKETLKKDLDDDSRGIVTSLITRYSKLVEEIPNVSLTLPSMTFESSLTIYGSERKAQILTFGAGHTDSDAILFIPDEGVVFTADLIVNGRHLYMGDSTPLEWINRIQDVAALEPKFVIPGHGNKGGNEIVNNQENYIKHIYEMASQMIEKNASREDLDKLALPDIYKSWPFPQNYANNINTMINALKSN